MNSSLQTQLQKSIDHLKKDFSALQIGRASVALVEDIEIDSYGTKMPLKQVANIACPDPKTIKIEPWDKGLLQTIEKTIQESNIGINPQNMGDALFLPIPPMTEERRKQVAKLVHELTEKAKISIRSIRQDSMKFIKMQEEENEISKDEQKDFETEVQEKINDANTQIDEISKKKEQEILSI
ncbi:ribosome recycling factor [Candidatus Gracilibacteria bacterium]|nr:ribosome recycling factor [Candidatus Gracilibacteria bacterium]